MHPTRSNTAHRTAREAIATTRQPLDATPESRLQTTPPRRRPTHDDASASAESVRITDRPAGAATASARSYLVERGLETKTELDALIADYLHTAEQLHAIPMSVTPLERYLEHLS